MLKSLNRFTTSGKPILGYEYDIRIELNRMGFDFICYSGDVWVLHNALAEAISALRQGCQVKKQGKKA